MLRSWPWVGSTHLVFSAAYLFAALVDAASPASAGADRLWPGQRLSHAPGGRPAILVCVTTPTS